MDIGRAAIRGLLDRVWVRSSPEITLVERRVARDPTSVAVELRQVSTVPAMPGYSKAGAVDKPMFW